MLGKLMKYEIQATSRFFLLAYVALLGVSILNRLLNYAGNSIDRLIGNNFLYTIATLVSRLLLGALIAAVAAGTIFYMINRFYQNFFRDEGYLMHTLPVPTWMLLASKMLVSALWILASGLVLFFSIGILIGEMPDFIDFFRLLNEAMQEAGANAPVIYTEVIFFMLVSLLGTMLPFFLAIAIGQMWKKHRILGAVLAYTGISTVIQFISGFFFFSVMAAPTTRTNEFPWGNSLTDGSFMEAWHSFVLPQMIISILCYALFFAVTHWLMSHKLNLE